MRILFMGTPDFAAVSLKRLVEDGHELCGVFTQPDKPRNRNKVTFSPVKEYALSQGLTVYQPTKLRDGTALELVKSLAPELIVVVAYGPYSAQGHSGRAAPWLRECPCVPAAQIPGFCPYQLGHAQRRRGDRRFHHVYGGGTGRR